MCDAAAIIDKSFFEGQQFKRANNRQKAQFNESSSVFVRNLPADVTDDALFQEFQKTGSVINCQVSRHLPRKLATLPIAVSNLNRLGV